MKVGGRTYICAGCRQDSQLGVTERVEPVDGSLRSDRVFYSAQSLNLTLDPRGSLLSVGLVAQTSHGLAAGCIDDGRFAPAGAGFWKGDDLARSACFEVVEQWICSENFFDIILVSKR